MGKAIVIEEHGSADVLNAVDVAVPANLSPNQVLVANKAIGVNRLEIEQRQNICDFAVPNILGVEAVGVVESVGSSVCDLQIGDRVGYYNIPHGAYCEKRVIDCSHLVKIPRYISNEVAAASLFKGVSAHYLLYKVSTLSRGAAIVMVHNVSDGVGYFLAQYARHAGHVVIGTVAADEDIDLGKRIGCAHVINYHDSDFVDKVMKITCGLGVTAVYDSVGKDTAKISLESLGLFGVYVIYGQSSGPTPRVSPQVLSYRSLFMTYTSIFHYKRLHFELALTATEVFKMIKNAALVPTVHRTYSLGEMRQAHLDLEQGRIKGSSVIML